MDEANFKPTLKEPMSDQSQDFEKDFKNTMKKNNLQLDEVNSMLNEKEQSLKKKIFSLAKMEALVFADPKLTSVYDGMAENGEEKYGYHYNETIMNMLFNDYVLNSPKYLQKYKMAVPKEKKRRDKSGINKLKKDGAASQPKTVEKKIADIKKDKGIDEEEDLTPATKVVFLIHQSHPEVFAYFPEMEHSSKYMTAYAHVGQHSAIDPRYAEESREATPDEYRDLQGELESIGYNLEVLNKMSESTSAGGGMGGAASPNQSGTGQYATPAAWKKGGGDLMESGASQEMISKPIQMITTMHENYLVDGDYFTKMYVSLNEEFKSKAQQRYFYAKASDDNESSEEREKFGKMAKEFSDDTDFSEIPEKVNEDYAIMNPEPMEQIGWISIPSYKYGGASVFEITQDDDFGTRSGAEYIMGSPYENEYVVKPNGENNYTVQQNPRFWQRYISLDQETKKVLYLDDNEKFKYLGKYSNIEIDPNKTWSRDSDTQKFWNEIEELKNSGATFEFDGKPIFDTDNKIKETDQTMANKPNQDNPETMANTLESGSMEVGMNSMNENDQLLEEINNELNAFSIHQEKLKEIAEDRKTPSQVINDRVTGDNPKNFKKDLQHSGTKDIINVEKELEWKDQQTDVPKDPQKLGADIEKTEIKTGDMESDEALKNVGDSANDAGDEVPKRNLTSKEQEEVNLYRNGQHSLTYDNDPGERFVERMKADQGQFFEMGEEQKKFKEGAPLYNKDNTFVEDAHEEKVQYDKNKKQSGAKVAWNERMGLGSNVKLGESMVSGRYLDVLGHTRFVDFRLNEAIEVETLEEGAVELDFIGIGNTYNSKVEINEGVQSIFDKYKFHTNGSTVWVSKAPVQNINETVKKSEKRVISESEKKMHHLLGYEPKNYVDTKRNKL